VSIVKLRSKFSFDLHEWRRLIRSVFLQDSASFILQIVKMICEAHDSAAEDQIFAEPIRTLGTGHRSSFSLLTEHPKKQSKVGLVPKRTMLHLKNGDDARAAPGV